MNNRTAHIQFKVILDKNAQGVAFGGAPAFLPQEIDLFLNQAQDDVISNKISGNNVLKLGFEGSLQRISELDKLIRTDENLIMQKNAYNEFVLDNVHADGNRVTIWAVTLKYGNNFANCMIVDHNTALLFKQTYNNIPWVEVPVVVLEDNKMLLYVDPILMQQTDYAPSNNKYAVNITYIKKPTQFDYTNLDGELDLPDDVMSEVINRAVVLALENIESQRTSSKLQLNQLSE